MTGKYSHLLDYTPCARRARTRMAIAMMATATVLIPGLGMSAGVAHAAADRGDTTSWGSVFESLRPVPASDTHQVIVTFDAPSLGEWAAAGHTGLTVGQQQRFMKRAADEQDQILQQVKDAGVQYRLEHRYLRVLNGVSLVVQGDNAQVIQSVRGIDTVTQVRTVYPASSSTQKAAAGVQAVSHSTGGGAYPTVAVLDTGIDFNHPDLANHQVGAGFDVLAGTAGVEAADSDEHGTQVAGAVVSASGGRVGVMPIRILDTQPVLGGAEAVVGTSDALIAGLEVAVDPNADGSVSDAVEVAVAAVSEPYAGFANAPEERAVSGAAALGTLTVAAAGNDGSSGDAVGTVGGPAAAAQALAVGAADLRETAPSATIHARGGLFDDSFGSVPLLTRSAAVPRDSVPLVVLGSSGSDVVDYLGDDARSRVGGMAVLLQQSPDATLADQVRAAADAGAVAVLISGADSGALSGVLHQRGVDIPAFGLSAKQAAAMTTAAEAARLDLDIDLDTAAANPAAGSVAGFSSRGPRYDGAGKPDVVAPGVGVRTSTPGVDSSGDPKYAYVSGTSVAAGYAAGVVASLRGAHPDWTVDRVRAAIIGSAALLGPEGDREAVEAQGGGLLNAAGAAGATVFATPGRVDFGALSPGTTNRASFAFQRLDGTVLALPKLQAETSGSHKLMPTVDADGHLSISIPDGTASGEYGGWLVNVRDGVRVPWTVAVRQVDEFDVPMTMSISDNAFQPATGPGRFPSTLQLSVGGVGVGGSLGLRAAQRIELSLADGKGKTLGRMGSLDQILPGLYSMGLTGLDTGGQPLAPGSYRVVVRYTSAAEPDASWSTGPSVTFSITK